MATLTQQKLKELEFYSFRPRADQPSRGDQQTAFLDSRHPGVTFLLGGNGCKAAEQPVYDPVAGVARRVDEIPGPFHVWSRDQFGNRVIAKAEKPHPCGVEHLYEIGLSNGEVVRVTAAHRVLDIQGQWREIRELVPPRLLSEPIAATNFRPSANDTQQTAPCLFPVWFDQPSWQLPKPSRDYRHTTSATGLAATNCPWHSESPCDDHRCRTFVSFLGGHIEGDPRCMDTEQGCLESCFACSRPCDEQPPADQDIAQVILPSPFDALEHTRRCSQTDDVDCGSKHTRNRLQSRRRPKIHFSQQERLCSEVSSAFLEPCSRSSRRGGIQFQSFRSNMAAIDLTTGRWRFPLASYHPSTNTSFDRAATASSLGGDQMLARSMSAFCSQPALGLRSLSPCAASIQPQCWRSSTTAIPSIRESRRSVPSSCRCCTSPPSSLLALASLASPSQFSSEEDREQGVFVTSVRYLRKDVYWDFHVPVYENYWMAGCWHHNSGTTTCGLAKAVEFMTFQQAPPRKDTPFWIIAKSFEQCMNVCWKEKLHQKGHLHPNDIDWDRIQWYRPTQDWPAKVPLKPKPGYPGRNWQLCFKSYEQGRGAMMGESIGGFLFVEQFPWGLLEEVLRGCREYAFEGNKLAEFTPVDPSLSLELRDMEENNSLPPGWAIYRANTRCAMEAGHITKQWYDMFFGMLPEATRKVREEGQWGSFEGAVYPEWNTAIHCLPDGWTVPPNCQHRRAVDFGYTLDHAFVVLWLAYDDQGRIFVYDEYYSTDTSKTVIDHWREVEDRHPWPLQHSAYYGCVWVDHDMDAIRTLMKIDEYTNGEYQAPSMQLAKKSVHEGIEAVHMMLKPTILDEHGNLVPRLRVVRENCPNLCREMLTYRYPAFLATGVNAQAPKQDPIKDKDDCVDALRYGVFSELVSKNVAPSTIAHQHSPGSIQINSPKLQRKRYARRPL